MGMRLGHAPEYVEEMRTLLKQLGDDGHACAERLRQAWAIDAFLSGALSAPEAASAAGVTPAEFRAWLDARDLAHLLDGARANGGRAARRRPEVSVVLPLYNEEENIEELHRRLVAALGVAGDYELLFVNDGSTDRSAELVRGLREQNPRVRLVNLSRNFGHQAAITAGMNYSAGRAVVILDADLQDPPEIIAEMHRRWRAGAKVVYAVRNKRKDGLLKRAAYFAFYRGLRALSHVSIPLDSGDCCLLDRVVVDRLNSLPERNRFLRGLRSWVGYEQVALTYERQSRHAGEPKYRFRGLVKLALDGIFSFSTVPLRLATYVGLGVCVFGLGFLAFSLFSYFVSAHVPVGWTSVVALILIVGGTQLFVCGILGEYVARIYDESKQRPLYVVESFVGGTGGEGGDEGIG